MCVSGKYLGESGVQQLLELVFGEEAVAAGNEDTGGHVILIHQTHPANPTCPERVSRCSQSVPLPTCTTAKASCDNTSISQCPVTEVKRSRDREKAIPSEDPHSCPTPQPGQLATSQHILLNQQSVGTVI